MHLADVGRKLITFLYTLTAHSIVHNFLVQGLMETENTTIFPVYVPFVFKTMCKFKCINLSVT